MVKETPLWSQVIVGPKASIKQALDVLNRVGLKIVLVVNDKGEFIGTISDGDIRRGLLSGLNLSSSIESVVHTNALVVPQHLPRNMIIKLMISNQIFQIPVVDENKRVIGLHLWREVTEKPLRENLMVIMAGGRGTRLLPYTRDCPKSLLPVMGKPILAHVIERAKLEGISHFVLAINYLGHMIEDYFGDGENFGVKIEYVREGSPLGTAGAINLLTPKPTSTFIVTNGDILSNVSFGDLLDFHNNNNSRATMAVRLNEWPNPFGVVQTDGVKIVGYQEKPVMRTIVNAGVYAIDPSVLHLMTDSAALDMPQLFEMIREEGEPTFAFMIHEPWLDVGSPEDLSEANKNLITYQDDAHD